MNKPLIEFNPRLPRLTKSELQVIDLLCEAAKMIVPIYQLQENPKFPGANFYPHDTIREEIEKAAQKNPDILSPYTIVKRKNGKLMAIPYHEEYADLLRPVSDKLLEASGISENKEFSKTLKIQAQALLDGNYERATITWMSMKPYVLDINIGPVERYDDKLFFIKTSYQAWLGVMDEEETKRLIAFKDIILTARRKALMPAEKVEYYEKVQIRMDDVLLLSGLIARTKFVGVNLPNDTHFMEKYGSEITIFKQNNEARFQTNWAIFQKLFAGNFREQFTQDNLRKGTLYSTALHELAHTYLRYHGSEERLKELFPIIDELGATVMGIKVCGSLLLKDVVNEKELESMMLAYMTRSFHNIINERDDKSKYHYTLGGAIFINYLIESRALQKSGGVRWPNFTKMFFSISELGSILERLLSTGTQKDAALLIKQYGHFEKLQKFN